VVFIRLVFTLSVLFACNSSYAENVIHTYTFKINNSYLNSPFNEVDCFSSPQLFLGCYGTDKKGDTYVLDVPKELEDYIQNLEIENHPLLMATWTEFAK